MIFTLFSRIFGSKIQWLVVAAYFKHILPQLLYRPCVPSHETVFYHLGGSSDVQHLIFHGLKIFAPKHLKHQDLLGSKPDIFAVCAHLLADNAVRQSSLAAKIPKIHRNTQKPSKYAKSLQTQKIRILVRQISRGCGPNPKKSASFASQVKNE